MNLIWQSQKSRIFTLVIAFYLPFNINAAERWYRQAQVDAGKPVFSTNCSICHGIDAVSTPQWRKPMDDGRYPPPPLNGTAHTWHHDLASLRRQIKRGGAKYGGWMPALGDSLKPEQLDEVIAYIQSLWPDNIYSAWLKRNAALPDKSPVIEQPAKINERKEMLRNLSRRLPNSKFGNPEETPLKGIFRLSMDDSVIYISGDGRFVFLGDMVNLITGRNISKAGIP